MHTIANDCLEDARYNKRMRNILLLTGLVSEVVIGIVDLAGYDYPEPSIRPYVYNGALWLMTAAVAHWSADYSARMSDDFCEGAIDVGVLDTYVNPETWEQQIAKPYD